MLKSELMDLINDLPDDAFVYIHMPYDGRVSKVKKITIDEDGDIILEP